jgi:hypothetical protein
MRYVSLKGNTTTTKHSHSAGSDEEGEQSTQAVCAAELLNVDDLH